MTFEEQLASAFETLTERLRGQIEQQVRQAAADLAAAAPYDRHPAVVEAARLELEAAVDAAKHDAHDRGVAVGREAAQAQAQIELTQALAAARQEAHEQGIEAGREAARFEAREELARAVAEARRESHEQGAAAGRESAEAQAREELARAVAEARREAHQQGVAEGREHGRAQALVELTPPPQVVKAVFDEHIVEAMRSMERAHSLTEILDALLRAARLDAAHAEVWLIRGGALHPWREADAGTATTVDAAKPLDDEDPIAAAARSNRSAAAAGTIALPMAISGVVVAVLGVALADAGAANSDAPNAERDTSNAEPGTANGERRTTNLALLTAYASRSLEALTAFKTARALTHIQEPPAPAAPAAPPPAADAEMSEEDTSARRYARLLVSEIKLYHEAEVADGRRDRDLATRLGGEIARARAMYEERVPPPVRARSEYFHDELVRTLANGDATLLELRT